jgi:hypothetical protein
MPVPRAPSARMLATTSPVSVMGVRARGEPRPPGPPVFRHVRIAKVDLVGFVAAGRIDALRRKAG